MAKVPDVGVGAIKLKSIVLSVPFSNVLVIMLESPVKGMVMILDSTVKEKVLVGATSVCDIFGTATEDVP